MTNAQKSAHSRSTTKSLSMRQLASATYGSKARTAFDQEAKDAAKRAKFEAAQAKRRQEAADKHARDLAYARALARPASYA